MVDRNTRSKKKKFRRTPGGKTKIHYTRKKISKAHCAITGTTLSGTGNQMKSAVRKTPKSARRPNVKFGGILSAGARKQLHEELALVISGFKSIEDVPAKYRKFIADLHRHWDRLGTLELCDRLDASTSVAYLLHPRYAGRLQYKALESLGRVWATLAVDKSKISEIIKNGYRTWFNIFGITEEKVEASASVFLLNI